MSRRTSSVAPLSARQMAQMDRAADAFLLIADADALKKRVAAAAANGIITTPQKLLKNDRRREQFGRGVALPPCDGRDQAKKTDAAHKDQIVKVDEAQLAPRFRETKKEKQKTWGDMSWAQQSGFARDPLDELVEAEEHELAAKEAEKLKNESFEANLRARADEIRPLLHALKPRDREVIEMLLDGMSVAQIAKAKKQTVQAIYASLRRSEKRLVAAKKRQDWVKGYCTISGTGDAPVILKENQQLGWDFGGAE